MEYSGASDSATADSRHRFVFRPAIFEGGIIVSLTMRLVPPHRVKRLLGKIYVVLKTTVSWLFRKISEPTR